MAFTTISNLSFIDNPADTKKTPYFHPEDIAIVMNQFGAKAVTLVQADVQGVACQVLIGVANFAITETTITITRLDSPQHLAALPCPPFNDEGGKHLPDPLPHDKTIQNQSAIGM